jgi:hypothetical protein
MDFGETICALAEAQGPEARREACVKIDPELLQELRLAGCVVGPDHALALTEKGHLCVAAELRSHDQRRMMEESKREKANR